MLKKLSIPTLLIFSFSVHSASSSDTLKNIMTTSKAAGVCEMYMQLFDFQKKEKMKGGSEFLAAFSQATVVDKGMTMGKFVETCKAAQKQFGDMETAVSNME